MFTHMINGPLWNTLSVHCLSHIYHWCGGCVALNEIIVIAIGIWKYLKIQDGRQNIEILLYVFKMVHIDFF